MSTEKSLLTYEQVKWPVLTEEQKKDGLLVPIGVTPGGNLETLLLKHELDTDHMLLSGRTGSGKSKALEFIIKSLCTLYGTGVTLSYVDGKNCDVKYWWNRCYTRVAMLRACDTTQDLGFAICTLLEYTERKSNPEPDIIVFDEIAHLLSKLPEQYALKLRMLLTVSGEQNIHVLFSCQSASNNTIINGAQYLSYFNTVCTTRVDDAESSNLFGGIIASPNGGMRRYGELVYRYRDNVSKVRVPFCDYHNFKEAI